MSNSECKLVKGDRVRIKQSHRGLCKILWIESDYALVGEEMREGAPIVCRIVDLERA